MDTCDIVIMILGLMCIGMAAFIILLDSRVDQLQGYIRRMEQEVWK